MGNVYVKNGYQNRYDYLRSLAFVLDIPYSTVAAYAAKLGPSEDFNSLVATLADEIEWGGM